jgi:hypothetical protein
MKILLSLLLICGAASYAGAQDAAIVTAAAPAETLTIKELEHDFGSIPKGKPVYYSFTVFNTGTTPLRLDDVHASCGCTTPEWSHDPIPAGGSASIKVGFNAAAEGPFSKSITVTYNTNLSKQLMIKGNVWRAPEGSAPANAAVSFLKKQTL